MFGSNPNSIQNRLGNYFTPSSFSLTNSIGSNKIFTEISDVPDDTISKLRFGPVANHLIATSWDKTIRVWQVNGCNSTLALKKSLNSIPFDVSWHPDGRKAFVGCSNGAVYVWNLECDQILQVAQHQAPVKVVNLIQTPAGEYLISGSWDKNLLCWDLNSDKPVHAIDLKYKMYDSAFQFPYYLVSTERMKLFLFNVQSGLPTPLANIDSGLRHQHRGLAFLSEPAAGSQPTGCVVGCIFGRARIINFNKQQESEVSQSIFPCHRTMSQKSTSIFTVNDVCVSKKYSKIITGGGDGKYMIRDAITRKIGPSSKRKPQAITSISLNFDETLLAVSSGYDWSEGHDKFLSSPKPVVHLHEIQSELAQDSHSF